VSRRAVVVGVLVLVAVFAGHAGFLLWRTQHVAAHWVTLEQRVPTSAWRQYLDRQDYYVGYSYALAAAFTAFAVTLSLERRRRSLGGVAGGFTLMGVMYGAGCFLIGCCGSPMLGIYLSVFGGKILGLLKPLMAAITTVAVLVSGAIVLRRARVAYCSECVLADKETSPAATTSAIPEPTARTSQGPD